jgi:hypothetical protein
MARQVRVPETEKLELKNGDWLLVKKRLNTGEQRAIFERMVKHMSPGEKVELDPKQVGHSQAVEYLIDWGTFVDAANKPLVIRGKSADEISAILNSLDPEDYIEIRDAIEAHVDLMDKARLAEKNDLAGGSASPATLPSVA